MVLKTRRWGTEGATAVVCVHGLAQHGGVFEGLGERLAAAGHSVTAVDLRGHGRSDRDPPWNRETHVNDLLETADSLGVDSATWIGHSFGGALAAGLAARCPDRVERLVLLDAGLGVPPARALRSAEIERLDWSFATPDGVVNALLSNEAIVASPREVVAAFVRDDVSKGPDGRYRLSFCPSTVVVAWSEMVLPPPPVARVPTLFVRAEVALYDGSAQVQRYTEALGDLLTVAEVPNGHNVLWESPRETTAAVERFLGSAAG
jgi:lipase